MGNQRLWFAGGCCCLGLLTAVILLAISFRTLQELDYGIAYNSITRTIDRNVYTKAGLYSLGPGKYFITYPRTVQTIEFTAAENDRLQTRTSDGLPVKLGVSFQYRYDPGRLVDLHLNFNREESEVFEKTAKATIANVAVNYTAYTFFNDKPGIAAAMQIALTDVFDKQLYAVVDAFQITQVELPGQFQQAILSSIEAKQNITQTERYKDNMMVTFQSQELVANQTKVQTVTLARGTADQRLEEAAAVVEITKRTVESEMYSYGNLSQIVGLDENGGLAYIWWDQQTASANSGKEFLVGLNPDSYIRTS